MRATAASAHADGWHHGRTRSAADGSKGPIAPMTHSPTSSHRSSNSSSPFLPPRWVIRSAWAIHRALFRITRGRLGLRRPAPGRYGLMRVTTRGRRTGRDRSVMLAYMEDGADLVTIAMNGWAEPEPAWWLNLQAEPRCEVVLPDGRRSMTGRAATGQERARLWERWYEVNDELDAYATMRPTETAVVVLEPVPAV